MVRVFGVAFLLLFSHVALVSAGSTARMPSTSCLSNLSESYDIQLNQLSCSPYAQFRAKTTRAALMAPIVVTIGSINVRPWIP